MAALYAEDELDTNSDENQKLTSKPRRKKHKLFKSLLNAIDDGNLDEVKEILTQLTPKQINRCIKTKNSGHNVTPLLWAVYNYQVEIAKLLIDSGANVNKQGSYEENRIVFNYTPLLKAIENDHERMIELLIDNGANVHLKAPGPRQMEEEGGSLSYVKWMYPMNLALHMENFNIFKMLMKKFDVSRIYDEGHHTCLCRAAMMFDTTVIQYMISKGAKMCHGEGKLNDAYTNPGVCQFFKNLIQNSFSIQFMTDSGSTYICEQNNFRCLMSICLTDYAWTGSMVHRAIIQYMVFAAAAQCPSLQDKGNSNGTQSDGGFDWLFRFSSSPSKLKHICRVMIREIMHGKLPDSIKLLPLPNQIMNYLSLEEDFAVINESDFTSGQYKDLTV